MTNQEFVSKLDTKLKSLKGYLICRIIVIETLGEDDLVLIKNENTGNMLLTFNTDYETIFHITFGTSSFYDIVDLVNCVKAVLEGE